MQIAGVKVDDPIAGGVLYIGVPDIPLLGNRPVKGLSTGWDFVNFEVDVFGEAAERFTHSITGDAATDRENVTGERKDLFANRGTIEAFDHVCANLGLTG